MKANLTHCIVVKPKENNLTVIMEGYVSKTKSVELKEFDTNDGKKNIVANASINLINQQVPIEYLLKTLNVSKDAIYTSTGQEDVYHNVKVTGFNVVATRMEKLMKPGNRIVLVGTPYLRQWEDNNGNIREDVSITITDFWVSNFTKL